MKSGIAELRARADILEVLEELGGRIALAGRSWDDETNVFCPFCADKDSDKPAGRANALKGLYFCFSCGTGGDVIKVVMIGKSLDFVSALEWLEERYPMKKDNPWTT